jgi:hypothetical protein
MSIRCAIGWHAYRYLTSECERCGHKHDSRKGGIIGPRDNALRVGAGIYVKPDIGRNLRPKFGPPRPRPKAPIRQFSDSDVLDLHDKYFPRPHIDQSLLVPSPPPIKWVIQ